MPYLRHGHRYPDSANQAVSYLNDSAVERYRGRPFQRKQGCSINERQYDKDRPDHHNEPVSETRQGKSGAEQHGTPKKRGHRYSGHILCCHSHIRPVLGVSRATVRRHGRAGPGHTCPIHCRDLRNPACARLPAGALVPYFLRLGRTPPRFSLDALPILALKQVRGKREKRDQTQHPGPDGPPLED